MTTPTKNLVEETALARFREIRAETKRGAELDETGKRSELSDWLLRGGSWMRLSRWSGRCRVRRI